LIRFKTLKALKITLVKGLTKSEVLKNEIFTLGLQALNPFDFFKWAYKKITPCL